MMGKPVQRDFRKKALSVTVVIFFTVQLLGLLRGRITDEKYFSWAPYDQISKYEIDVEINGRQLSTGAVSSRYRISARGRENRSIHNILSLVQQYEKSYGRQDSAKVEVLYTINGHQSSTWTWPDESVK